MGRWAITLFLYKFFLYGKLFHRVFHPPKLCWNYVFYSLYLDPVADITAKLEIVSVVQHKKIGSQQKQKREAKSSNTDCHLQGLCCHKDTSLAFYSASETMHERIKYCGQHLLYQLFPVCLVLNHLSKLYTQHPISNERKKVLPSCSKNHAATKWPSLGSFFRLSSRMPNFFPLHSERNHRESVIA